MSYLEKLKSQKSPNDLLQKLQKVEKKKNKPTSPTAKTAKTPFYTFCSTPTGHISGKNIQTEDQKKDKAFDILDRLLAGGRTTTMNEWRKLCQAAGVGEIEMWMARFEVESFVEFKDGNIKIK
jgi:hypothetical protein